MIAINIFVIVTFRRNATYKYMLCDSNNVTSCNMFVSSNGTTFLKLMYLLTAYKVVDMKQDF